MLFLSRSTTGAPSNGIGAKISFNTYDVNGYGRVGSIGFRLDDVTSGTKSFVVSTQYEELILDNYGNLSVIGSIKPGNDSASASSLNVGAIRYRTSVNNSYCEMVMQTGSSTYAWVIIKQNTW